MATSYAAIALQAEESLRKADIDALIVELEQVVASREIVHLLVAFIAFPRVKEAVQKRIEYFDRVHMESN